MSGFGFSIIFVLFVMLGLFVLNIATSVWAYRDAKDLGRSNEYALLVLIATLFFPVVGLIVYIIIRKS